MVKRGICVWLVPIVLAFYIEVLLYVCLHRHCRGWRLLDSIVRYWSCAKAWGHFTMVCITCCTRAVIKRMLMWLWNRSVQLFVRWCWCSNVVMQQSISPLCHFPIVLSVNADADQKSAWKMLCVSVARMCLWHDTVQCKPQSWWAWIYNRKKKKVMMVRWTGKNNFFGTCWQIKTHRG